MEANEPTVPVATRIPVEAYKSLEDLARRRGYVRPTGRANLSKIMAELIHKGLSEAGEYGERRSGTTTS